MTMNFWSDALQVSHMSILVYSLCLYQLIFAGHEYVKVVLQNGRMQGAILIGETDLEVDDFMQ